MQVVYAAESPPDTLTKSIFLAGPSPRNQEHLNWRKEALQILEVQGYDGVVFIPLPRDGGWPNSYEAQVEWENTHLHMADVVLFWVPRDLSVTRDVIKDESAERAMKLPAFTTNVEWGKWFDSGKAILGFPSEASKMRYLEYEAGPQGVPVKHSLEDTLAAAVNRLGKGARRTGGERQVPLHIWNLPHFQGWLQSQKEAGNRFDGAKLLWTFRVGPTKGFTFAYTLHVNVHVASENRNKTNEFIFGRPDISTVVAWCPGEEGEGLGDTKIILIREFRSPANTPDGFIREVPGGSSWKAGEDPFITMAHELEEETGLAIDDPSRILKVGSRQVAGTLSVHKAHVFMVELTDSEFEYLEEQARHNLVHGQEGDSERTYVEIQTMWDLLSMGEVDWSTMGMILTALVPRL